MFGRKNYVCMHAYMLSFQLCYWQTCSVVSHFSADFPSVVVSNVVKAECCDNSSRLKVKLILQLKAKEFVYFCTLICIRLETRPSVGNKHLNVVPSDSSSQKKRSLQASW